MLYTAFCDYYATGEGLTSMLLITTGSDDEQGKDIVLGRFAELFGEYFARGAEVHGGVRLDLVTRADYLIGPLAVAKLYDAESVPSYEYFASMHFNYS